MNIFSQNHEIRSLFRSTKVISAKLPRKKKKTLTHQIRIYVQNIVLDKVFDKKSDTTLIRDT